MEVFVILLSSLIGLISPVGVVSDRLAQTAIRKQLTDAEQLLVRIDNAPTYQLLQGKVDRIRVAGRGLFPFKDVRIEALEIETDPIQLDAVRLRRGKPRLVAPLSSGIRLVIKAEDAQRALRSPQAVAQLRQLSTRVLDRRDARRVQKLQILNPRIEFLDQQRLRLQFQLREGEQDTLNVFVESGLAVINGTQLRLVNPIVRLDDELVSERLLQGIAAGVVERSDLRRFEKSGITGRILQFQLNRQQLELAVFVQIKPS